VPDALNRRGGPVAAWDRFFFTPADPRPLGLMRIAVGLLLFWSLAVLGLDLRGMMGSEGWVDQAILSEYRQRTGVLEWSLWDATTDRTLWPAWGLALVVVGLFTAGVGSRVTAPLAWAIAVSTTRRNPAILFGFDHIVTLWTFYLAVSGACGRAFSVDRLIADRRGNVGFGAPCVSANIGLRLTQVTLAMVYGFAGLAKVGGVSWMDGSAVMKTLGNAEFRPFNLTGILGLPGGEFFLNLCTHLALWTELLYPILIWKPAFRRYVLAAAVAMHLGIALTMGLTVFSLAMIAANLAFVRFDDGGKAAGAVRSGVGDSAEPASARSDPNPRRPRR